MITLITGGNSFENERALKGIVNAFKGIPERIDGASLDVTALPDLLMGGTLFSHERLIIVRGLTENKTVWNALADWLPRVTEDTQVVLVEPDVDKRSKTYKALQKTATTISNSLWDSRDVTRVEQWVIGEGCSLGVSLDKGSAHALVERIGFNQWELMHALEKLSVLESVNSQDIEKLIDANPSENVFILFESALKGDVEGVRRILKTVAITEDAYRLLGLLGGQAVQLGVLAVSVSSVAEVAKDVGVHPYALSKLASSSKQLGRLKTGKIVTIFREADEAIKVSMADPWVLIEQALLKVALLK